MRDAVAAFTSPVLLFRNVDPTPLLVDESPVPSSRMFHPRPPLSPDQLPLFNSQRDLCEGKIEKVTPLLIAFGYSTTPSVVPSCFISDSMPQPSQLSSPSGSLAVPAINQARVDLRNFAPAAASTWSPCSYASLGPTLDSTCSGKPSLISPCCVTISTISPSSNSFLFFTAFITIYHIFISVISGLISTSSPLKCNH